MSRIVRAVSAGDVSGASGIDPLPDGHSGAGLYAIKQASRIRPTSTISRFSKLQVKAGSAAGRRPRIIHHAIFSRWLRPNASTTFVWTGATSSLTLSEPNAGPPRAPRGEVGLPNLASSLDELVASQWRLRN